MASSTSTDTLEATGAGSVLTLPKLATITEDTTHYSSRIQIEALAGGSVGLPLLTSITGGPVQLESDGTGSTLNINALTTLQGNASQEYYAGVQATNHGSVSDAVLATLKQANLTLDGTGTISLGQIATLSGGTVSASGGTIALSGLTAADGSSFLVSGGASLTVPALTSYAGPINVTATWEATGTNSLLSFTKLAAITEDTGSYSSRTLIEALSSGDVELAKLATISGGPVALESDGSASKLNAPILTSVTGHIFQQYSSTLQASNSGSLLVPELATFDAGTIIDQGATLSLPALGNIDGSSVLVSSGSQLSLPALLTFSGGANYTELLQATGTGSRLSLPALTKVTGDTSAYSSLVQVQALSGGDVELPKLTTITGGPVQLESDGSGSTLNINVLTSIQGNAGQQYYSGLQATNHGTVTDAALTTLQKANLTLDGTGTISLGQIATFTVATVSLSGGTANLSGLTDADNSSFFVSGGGKLTLSSLVNYAGAVNVTATWQATGAGSLLSLTKLTTITEDTGSYSSRTQIQALSGGDVELPKLTTISGGPVQLESDGSGSTLNINMLTSIQGNASQQYYSGLQATNHGTVTDAALTTLKQANLTLDGTGTVSLGQIATLSGGTVSVSGGTIALSGLTAADGSSFLVSGGASLTVAALTSYAGPINVTATWEATGTNSLLSFTKLAAITEDTGSYSSRTLIEALSSGDVELAKLATISGGPVALESDGSGSKLNAPILTSVTGHVFQQYSSTLQASNSGSLLVPELATFDAGTIIDQGATLSLPALGNIDGSSVLVSSGSQLSLPALLTYSGGANYTELLQATGTGSRLSLPALTKVTGDTSAYSSLVQVKALSGGDVELPKLTTITGGPVQLESDGSGSTLNINVLTIDSRQRRPAVLLRPPGDQPRHGHRCGAGHASKSGSDARWHWH